PSVVISIFIVCPYIVESYQRLLGATFMPTRRFVTQVLKKLENQGIGEHFADDRFTTETKARRSDALNCVTPNR
ncbi:MAG: hypothetical protein MUC83_16660, partial [Pirellula sp.]|nr:hypothetical protein [Pirellula sp.]